MAEQVRGNTLYMSETNVFDAAIQRLHWLFDEFDEDVAVSSSGGKDSTVTVELAALVNRQRGNPPLRVIFLDQECEFQGTVDYQRYLAYEREDIDFRWYQVPFMLDNATSSRDKFLHVWDPEHPEVWVREKEPAPVGVHSTDIPYDRFYDLLSEVNARTARVVLTGMRGEEAPTRRMTLTAAPVYKWVTWGSLGRKTVTREQAYRFHPIYDWSYRDIWKAIDEHGWRYNEIYEHQYRWGVPTRKMRVSNYHHETSVYALSYLQEAEPETWEAATRRLEGINTRGHLGDEQLPDTLPYMFTSWREYANHLIDNLIEPDDPDGAEEFRKHERNLDKHCAHVPEDSRSRVLAKAVILNDQWGTVIENFMTANRRKAS